MQKKLPLTKEQIKRLRDLNLIMGKMPNTFVSASVAEIIKKKAQYIINRDLDESYYKKPIIDYLNQFGKGATDEKVKLLEDKLPDILTDKQKNDKKLSFYGRDHTYSKVTGDVHETQDAKEVEPDVGNAHNKLLGGNQTGASQKVW
jgi:hypothetical protein